MDRCECSWQEATGKERATDAREETQPVRVPEVEEGKGFIVQVRDWLWISVETLLPFD